MRAVAWLCHLDPGVRGSCCGACSIDIVYFISGYLALSPALRCYLVQSQISSWSRLCVPPRYMQVVGSLVGRLQRACLERRMLVGLLRCSSALRLVHTMRRAPRQSVITYACISQGAVCNRRAHELCAGTETLLVFYSNF